MEVFELILRQKKTRNTTRLLGKERVAYEFEDVIISLPSRKPAKFDFDGNTGSRSRIPKINQVIH